MADPELTLLRERIQALQVELAKHKHSAHVLETTETNLHLFARGLAHDFNNLLTGILGHAALIQSAGDVGEESRDAAGVIYKAAERATELVGQLMNFTRGGIVRALPFDVHEAVREVAELLRRSLEPDIQLVINLRASRPFVNGDRGQIHQALLNLLLNARDAMPGGGTLTVETADHAAGGAEFADAAILVAVRDTGGGIPESIRDTIFKPFFTTKPKSRGSGMGLAIVDRVLKNHRGAIFVSSRLGEGTEFRVYLPVRQPA